MPSSRNVSLGVATLVVGTLLGGVSGSITGSRLQPGSTIIQGDTYYVTTNALNSSLNNPNPSLQIDSGSALTYLGGSGIPGGGIRLTASGSRDFSALQLIPTKYASGGVIEGFSLEMNKQPQTTSGSFVMNCPTAKSGIGQCTAIRSFVRFATGTLLVADTGAIKTTKAIPGTYAGFISNASGGAAIFGGAGPSGRATDGAVKIKMHEKYGR